MLRQLAGRVSAFFRRHPDDGALLSLQDGELSGKRRARALSHLQGCDRCRTRATRIEQEWKRIAGLGITARTNPSFQEEEMIARIRTSIRAWNATNIVQAPPQKAQAISHEEAERQMVALLAVYLGQRVAGTLIHLSGTTPLSSRESIDSANSTLTALMGREGAKTISARLIQILNRVPKSNAGSSFS